MVIKTKLRLSSLEKHESAERDYFIAKFLDEDDNKFQFFIDEYFYNELSKHKQYDVIDLSFNLYVSPKGRYGMSML